MKPQLESNCGCKAVITIVVRRFQYLN